VPIVRNHFFCSARYHFRLILKRSASKCTKYYHFSTVQHGNIQNPVQPLFMDFQEFPVTDFCRPIAIILIEAIARSLPKVRRCAGDNVNIIPVLPESASGFSQTVPGHP